MMDGMVFEVDQSSNSVRLVDGTIVSIVIGFLDSLVGWGGGVDLLLNASKKSARQYYIAKVLQSVASRNK
jgi:hypothetical protein